jgi:hypothetical protein
MEKICGQKLPSQLVRFKLTCRGLYRWEEKKGGGGGGRHTYTYTHANTHITYLPPDTRLSITLYLEGPGPQHVHVRAQVHEALGVNRHQIRDLTVREVLRDVKWIA